MMHIQMVVRAINLHVLQAGKSFAVRYLIFVVGL